ncbi:MAG: hypothetical protein OEP45_13345, partial [Acidobacteriota bacterium]|nr:hypothetical protein [Acidobacteriota bacterium]
MRSLSTLLALIPAVAVAQMPLGDEFQVNTYTTNDQSVAALGPDGAGGFVAAWASWGSSGTDTASASIQAQRFAIDGSTAGAEFQVNTFTTGLQYDPAIGPDGAGGFVVTWWSEGSPGDDDDWYSVQAQRYAADGAPQGDQFQVNSYTADSQYFPAVGPDGSGGFVVAWTC